MDLPTTSKTGNLSDDEEDFLGFDDSDGFKEEISRLPQPIIRKLKQKRASTSSGNYQVYGFLSNTPASSTSTPSRSLGSSDSKALEIVESPVAPDPTSEQPAPMKIEPPDFGATSDSVALTSLKEISTDPKMEDTQTDDSAPFDIKDTVPNTSNLVSSEEKDLVLSQSVTKTLENTPLLDTSLHLQPPDHLSGTPTPRKLPATNTPGSLASKKMYDNPIYRKPFEFKWKREVVYRANPSEKSNYREKGDVYYITPTGKRVRTKNEIIKNLSPFPELTIENFTFSKETVGGIPGDEEIIRYAKPSASNKRTPDHLIQVQAQSEGLQNLGKRIIKPKLPKGATPPSPPLPSSLHRIPTKDVKFKPTIEKKAIIQAAATTDNSKGETKPKKHLPCTITCVKACGIIPQLQCIKCYCLYHHECVDMPKRSTSSNTFLCRDCVQAKQEQAKLGKGNQAQIKTEAHIKTMPSKNLPPLQTWAVIGGRRFLVMSRPLQT